MSDLPPGIVAQGDQIMARADEKLQTWIDQFRHHTAAHNGETLCPFAEVSTHALFHNALEVVELLAAAITRLAHQNATE